MAIKLETAEEGLRLSIMALLRGMGPTVQPIPRQRILAWAGGELERIASEAYRLADEAGDDPGSDPCRYPIPGFDPCDDAEPPGGAKGS